MGISFEPRPTLPSQLFAYVTNPMAGTITAYTIDTSGMLVPLPATRRVE